jgi:hypothetical protein
LRNFSLSFVNFYSIQNLLFSNKKEKKNTPKVKEKVAAVKPAINEKNFKVQI